VGWGLQLYYPLLQLLLRNSLVADKLRVHMAGNAGNVDNNAAAAVVVVAVADDILAMQPDIADIADTVARIAGLLQ